MFLPAKALGTLFMDGAGNVPSGSLNVSIDGVAGTVDISGATGEVNADCTGSLDINLGDKQGAGKSSPSS